MFIFIIKYKNIYIYIHTFTICILYKIVQTNCKYINIKKIH